MEILNLFDENIKSGFLIMLIIYCSYYESINLAIKLILSFFLS